MSYRQGVAEHCFRVLAPGHPSNSLHNLAICGSLIAQAAVGPSFLAAYDVPQRVWPDTELHGRYAAIVRVHAHEPYDPIAAATGAASLCCWQGTPEDTCSACAIHKCLWWISAAQQLRESCCCQSLLLCEGRPQQHHGLHLTPMHRC